MSTKFPKSERLNSQSVIEQIFKKSSSIKEFPFLLKYRRHSFEKGAKVQIAISIPKRRVKKAVDRNRLKRQIKEGYRLNKAPLLEKFKNKEQGLALFLIYSGSETATYAKLENKIKVLLQQLENLEG